MNNKILFSIIAVAFVGGMFTVAYAGPIMPKITLAGNVDVTGDLDVNGPITSPTITDLENQISHTSLPNQVIVSIQESGVSGCEENNSCVAVIAAESLFDSRAVSKKGAQGLMQLMPATAAALGVEDPMVAEQNVNGGVRYLRAMLDRYDDMSHALAAYNAGPTAVDRYRGIPPYRETRDYVKRVLIYYRHYHGDFPR